MTPTFSGDLARTTLLVESHEATGTDLPLFLIAHTEDASLFRPLAGDGVSVLTTADVLPARLETRRRNRLPRRDPRRYVRGAPLHGWMSQQLVKILAPTVLGVDVVLCLDSDCALLRPVTVEHLVDDDGDALLFASADDNALTMSWAIHSMKVLGVELASAQLRQYVHQGVVLSRGTTERLRAHLESRHGSPWWQPFVDEGLTEYMTYGCFAAHVDTDYGLTVAPPLDIATYWTAPDRDLRLDMSERLARTKPLAVCVQSALHTHPAHYRDVVASWWT